MIPRSNISASISSNQAVAEKRHQGWRALQRGYARIAIKLFNAVDVDTFYVCQSCSRRYCRRGSPEIRGRSIESMVYQSLMWIRLLRFGKGTQSRKRTKSASSSC